MKSDHPVPALGGHTLGIAAKLIIHLYNGMKRE